MFDIANLLNVRLQESDVWAYMADAVEDAFNRLVGDATDEALRADNGYRYLRGDIVDPRTFPNLQPVDPTVAPDYTTLVANRVREATVNVCYPILDDDPLVINPGDNALLYLDIGGNLYWTPVARFVSRDLLIKEAQYQGFDYFSDTLTDADYARMVEHIGQYWHQSGSLAAFGHFLGFIKDVRVELQQLWTEDDVNAFYTHLRPLSLVMTPFYEGGVWYPTAHRELYYDVLTSSANPNEFRTLFYLLAPIHLVLQRLVPTVFGGVDLRLTASGMPTVFERGEISYDKI